MAAQDLCLGDFEYAVKIYTTDTIVDNPGAEVVYKGFIIVHNSSMHLTLADITKMAKEKAKELNANAIIGVKISEGAAMRPERTHNQFTFIGTAVHVSQQGE